MNQSGLLYTKKCSFFEQMVKKRDLFKHCTLPLPSSQTLQPHQLHKNPRQLCQILWNTPTLPIWALVIGDQMILFLKYKVLL